MFAVSARVKRSWLMLGVMTLAITWGFAIAAITAFGAWPKPSMP